MRPVYAPLWCKSNFSFLEGASHAEELVEEAHRLGLRSIALTDRDGDRAARTTESRGECRQLLGSPRSEHDARSALDDDLGGLCPDAGRRACDDDDLVLHGGIVGDRFRISR